MASLRTPVRMLVAFRAAHTPPTHPYIRALGPHFSTWHKLPTTLNRITSTPVLRVYGSDGVAGIRHIAEWHTKRHSKALSPRDSVVVSLSLGVFLAYFMWLREPSDIDEHMNQPIWKRVPGIDPEKAEQMMEVDKYLGLQVDYAELEKYKQEYYAAKLEKLNKEQQQRNRHQELLQVAASRGGTFGSPQKTYNDAETQK